jgi:predicted ester cyclase
MWHLRPLVVIASLRRALSDFQLQIDDLAVAGDTVWLRMTGTGTNDGSFMGHPPTGRPMRTDVFDALRVDNGRIVWSLLPPPRSSSV